MNLRSVAVVDGRLRDAAWELYSSTFDELRKTAVQRHLMTRAEFDENMADPRVEKFLVESDDGRLAGLGTLTNELAAMPLISPEYFEHRWPEEYAEQRIWYVGFIGVHPDFRRSLTFRMLLENMSAVGQKVNGVVGMDMCAFNVEQLHLPDHVERLLTRLYPAVSVTRLDEQSYWSYEFPAAPVSA